MNATTALLIIDVQNDFCPGGALAVDDGDAIVPAINQLQAQFSVKVLTQDWHPSTHQSFAANHDDKEPFSMTEMPYGDQVLWPTHCVQGTQGAAFHPKLATDDANLVIRKGFRPHIDSYSAFFENDQTTPTGLAGYLRDRDIDTVYLTGLATDYCVFYSASDAVRLGFSVNLVEDCCRAIDLDGSLKVAMDGMRNQGVTMLNSRDIT